MRTNNRIRVPERASALLSLLLFGAALAFGQQTINLTAGSSNATLPDGSSVPMWGYSCGAAVSGSTATCAALHPGATGWSPVVITVPSGQDLTVNLTNSLSFANGNTVPTSLVIVGQLGGGLGATPIRTPSPDHSGAQNAVTWPIVDKTTSGLTQKQLDRVQSFSTEVAAGATTALNWKAPRPGTYLIESGTHPSIQGPMGLYGILVVTDATNGVAYPNVKYDADVPLLMSEIDPVQNKAVNIAVNTAGFQETAVWSAKPSDCGDATVHSCYPPAVNYSPLYYLFNGVAFDKTNASASLFTAAKSQIPTPTGNVLVRFVNAGLRMHVPSIVGAQTGASATSGFSLIAEDGNPLPGTTRVQSEVFMAAGKTYDVMINAPASGAKALPVYDRSLGLSGNATQRDAGMLAYLSVNGAALPSTSAFGNAVANPDSYASVVPGQTLSVLDAAKGVIANDVNVYGVKVGTTAPGHGVLTLNSNGTFTYVPDNTWTSSTSDTFTYQATNAAATATVTLSAAPIEAAGGITVNPITYTSSLAKSISIKTPGVLSVDSDGKGYPLTVVTSSVTPVGGLTVSMDSHGGFNATATGPGTYTFTYKAQNSQGTVSSTAATVTVIFPQPTGLTVTLQDGKTKAALPPDYRWIIEEDRTFYVDPAKTTNTGAAGSTSASTFGTNFHTSYMPLVATGCVGTVSCESGQKVGGADAVCDLGNGVCRTDAAQQTAVDPSQVHLDPTKRYYISVLPGDGANYLNSSGPNTGHGMGGAPIAAGQTSVTVLVEPTPLPPSKLTVFVYEDDAPLNGEQDSGGGVDVLAPNEPGLEGFNITIFDAAGGPGDFTGQLTYDMFNMPLSNSLAGTPDPANNNIDACPISKTSRTGFDVSGDTPVPGAKSATGITGTIVTCPKYEADGKTLSPLAGQAVIANMMPGRYGVVATPGADRIGRGEEWLQTNTLDGQKAHDSFLKVGEPAFFQEYGPAGFHVSIGFANPKIINGRLAEVQAGAIAAKQSASNSITGRVTTERMSRTPDERLYSSSSRDSFAFSQCYVSVGDPDGEDFAFTKCNADGTFTISGLPDGDWRVTTFDQWNDQLVDGLSTPVRLAGGKQVNMGDIAATQWQANIYTRTFFDQNGDGISQDKEPGLSLVDTNIRFRDGSFSNFNSTDLNGYANFNEVFPLFNWYVIETDTTRYKSTGTHVVYDAGGPADGSDSCGKPGYPPCGNSTIGQFMANTVEQVPLPSNLRVPGSVYCDNADCTNFSIAKGPVVGGSSGAGGSTGRIDAPWVDTYGWQGFSGQNSFLEFGKKPFADKENGGIHGDVVYASTRPFDDPQLLLQLSWEPQVPHVTVNLYQEGTAPDGSTSLKLVDTTQTSSFDDWAQGFRSDGVPNMNCPGQTTSDLFYFSLYNQPQYLDVYNNGAPTHTLPNNSQFKCYDGMHNWNQLQPAPYDGMYKFPSVTSINPTTGKPAGTNCSICIPDPDSTDPYRSGTPMLPAGKYVVEVVVPPGYELVKEEDKNILIGDNYIAPVTQQFAGLGNIFILPDQAAVADTYNANNAQNPTTNLGSTSFPRHEGDTGSVESYWPCVGESRVVPDFISLYPNSAEVSPFAGATRNLCDRKEITLGDQMSALAKFYVFTSTHASAHFTGVITDDFTSEFDPFSPQFGEKFAPPDLPVSVKDWAGNEINRVYADHWGAYNGLNYSTWEVNPPNPTGYAPTMMIMCMNDPGTGSTPDPLFNPGYSQFCYELPFMPGQTQYMDTPVTPTSAFSEGYNHPDCAYPDATPAISEVDGDAKGPWVSGSGGGTVAAVNVTNGGGNYTSAPGVTFTGGGGTGAAGNATIGSSGSVGSVNLGAHGTGYTSAPSVTFSAPPSGTTATGTAVISGSVASVKIATGGSGYLVRANVTFSGGGGTGAQGTAVMSNNNGLGSGSVLSVTITNGGTGYTSAPSVTFNKPLLGPAATGMTTITSGVASVTLVNRGTGYATAPTITFAGGGGSGAAAAAVLSNIVTGVNITNHGSGYTSAPTVGFSGGGGSGAAATAVISTGPSLTIKSLGDVPVINNGYAGPSATTAPFNQKTVLRHYGFGNATGTVTIGGVAASVSSWTDSQIVVSVPGSVPNCTIQQQGQSNVKCGQLVITTAAGKQSIDAVTVTIGGPTPKHVTTGTTIQSAIDAATPGDLIIVDPGVYNEFLLMWKPVRLQGVGAASSVINANTHPAGKLDPWRQRVGCLFGLALNGQPVSSSNPFDQPGGATCGGWTGFKGVANDPQVDRLPLEGILGWDTTVNGNLAQLLQEPTLMGAYEGAGITVLGKGVKLPGGPNINIFGTGAESAFPAGTRLLTNSSADCTSYPSNFLCNPSSIDGLSITNSSQGGGGIFVHAWGHNLQIANNRVYNNAGTLTGGITVGQGESPDAYLQGDAGNSDPGSCKNALLPNTQLPYCFDLNVNVHNNMVALNSSIGDELYSSTPAGGGGVTFCTGADYYQFQYNWVCGNLSTGDGGGLVHLGYIWNGDIEHNTILFNQSTNPTVSTNGGGIMVMGAPPDGLTAAGTECGNTAADADCTPGLSDGTGPNLTINANLIMGNAAESGSGGGLRLQGVNGTEVVAFPLLAFQWNNVNVTNNIISNNVAGWDGAGISLQDALVVNIINNSIVSNDTTASAGVLFNTLGAPIASSQGPTCTANCGTVSNPQAAGLVTMQHSAVFLSSLPSLVLCPLGHGLADGSCKSYSNPLLYNDVFWQNRSFDIGVGALDPTYQQNIVKLYNAFTTTPAPSQPQADTTIPNGGGTIITGGTGACTSASYWDIGVRGDTKPTDHSSGFTLSPTYSVLTDTTGYDPTNTTSNPTVVSQYCNGSRTPPELASGGWQVPPGISDATVPNPIFNLTPNATVDEGNNWINIAWGPLALTNPKTNAVLGDYRLAAGSPDIDYIPPTSTQGKAAPTTDFFGHPRPAVANTKIDVGAVEYQPPANTPVGSISGGPLAFGNVAVGSTATQTLTLQNQGTANLVVTGVALTPGQFTRPTGTTGGTCSATPITLASGATCTINVVFTPAAQITYTGTLTVTANVAVISSPVTLSGTGAPVTRSASVTPSPLAFGTWATGTTSGAQTLTVTNTGNVALAGGTFTFSGSTAFTRPAGNNGGTCAATLALGASCTINVVFAPGTTTGPLSGVLAVTYTGATVTPTSVPLTGSGTATKATVSITPNPLRITVPTGILNVTGTGVVTLTNTSPVGGTSMSISSVAISGGNVLTYFFNAVTGTGADTCTGANLAPGASCNVSVRFTNVFSARGADRAGTIVFTDSSGSQTGALVGHSNP